MASWTDPRRAHRRSEVERVNGHRFEAGGTVCSRCGVLLEEAELEPCVTSTVDVVAREDPPDGGSERR